MAKDKKEVKEVAKEENKDIKRKCTCGAEIKLIGDMEVLCECGVKHIK